MAEQTQKTQEQLDEELIEAAQFGRASLCRQLITEGANVNYSAPDSAPALHWAVFYSHVEVIELLVASGADVNAHDSQDSAIPGKNALAWAVLRKHSPAIVTLLLGAGANPNRLTGNFEWPLLHAVTQGSYELAEALVAGGARSQFMPRSPGLDTRSAFQEAVFRGLDREVALFARACSENIDQVTFNGKTMFELAPSEATRELLRSLRAERAIDAGLAVPAGEVAEQPRTRALVCAPSL